MTETNESGKKILLVDDEPSVLFALKLLLQAFGHTVIDVSNPVLVSEELRVRADIDLIMCDLRMPAMDGMEVLRDVRRTLPNLPFILMSGHASNEEAEEVFTLGHAGFLAKPFSVEELNDLFSSLLDDDNMASISSR